MIKYFLVFREVLRLGSFTKAGERLGYSQSSVSQMISQFEKEVGTKLLSRNRNKIELTASGKHLLPFIEEVCKNYEIFQEEVSNLTNRIKTTLKFGTFNSIGTTYMPSVLKNFTDNEPLIDLQIQYYPTYEEIEAAILDGTLDIGIVIRDRINHLNLDIEIQELKTEPFFAVMHPSHPLANKRRFPIENIQGAAFLSCDEGSFNSVLWKLEQYEIHPNVIFQTHNEQLILSLVESGMGITILSKMMLESSKQFHVVSIPLEPSFTRHICIGYKNYQKLSDEAKLLINYIQDGFM